MNIQRDDAGKSSKTCFSLSDTPINKDKLSFDIGSKLGPYLSCEPREFEMKTNIHTRIIYVCYHI